MKEKISLILIVAFITLFSDEVIYQLAEHKAEIHVSNSVAEFPGSPIFGLLGEPNLPVDNITLLLPPDADLNTVSVFIKNSRIIDVNGKFDINPRYPMRTTDGLIETDLRKSIVNNRDVGIYSLNSFFPKNCIRSVQVGQLRNYKLIDIIVQRYQFNPVLGKLKHLSAGNISVTFDKLTTRQNLSYSVPSTFPAIVKDIADNYETMANEYFALRTVKKSTYLIITTSSIQSSSTVLSKFINIKMNQGFDVEIITESTWGGGTGDAAMNKIRGWLQSNYQSKNIEFVFIIGNPDQSSQLPMTHGPSASATKPLIDYCYADLTESEWKTDGNVYTEYSENGVTQLDFDKYAEVHVGRLPVYGDNISTTDILLTKMIDYAVEKKESAESWRYSALLPMANFSDAQNGVVFGEAINNDFLKPSNWSVFRVYKDHMGIPAEGYPLTYENTKNYWNAGKFGIMIWQGHGLPTETFSGPGEYVMNSPTAASLTPEYPSHGFQLSCHNGCPFNPDNLGFALFKTGAISTIASAIEIWYSAMNTDFGTKSNGNDFGYIYVQSLIEDKLGAAAAFNKTRAYLPVSGTQGWQNCTELNLYGCPATGVYTFDVSDQTNMQESSLIKQKHTFNLVTSVGKKSVIFNFNGLIKNSGTIDIMDLRGKLIARLNVSDSNSAVWNYTETHVSKGVYFAVFNFQNNQTARLKFYLK